MWRQLIIAICLIGSVPLGQAQEQQSQTQGKENDQEPASRSTIFVKIVEDEAETQAAKSAEQESRDRQIEDLSAQKGMHYEAERMADYAFVQTWLVGIGTFLLIATLMLTAMANGAALKAVRATERMGIAQVRAYLSVRKIVMEANPEPRRRVRNGVEEVSSFLRLQFAARNYGLTPARSVRVVGVIQIRGTVPDSTLVCPLRQFDEDRQDVAPKKDVLLGDDFGYIDIQLSVEEGRLLTEGGGSVWIEIFIYYGNVVSKDDHSTPVFYRFDWDRENHQWRQQKMPESNLQT